MATRQRTLRDHAEHLYVGAAAYYALRRCPCGACQKHHWQAVVGLALYRREFAMVSAALSPEDRKRLAAFMLCCDVDFGIARA